MGRFPRLRGAVSALAAAFLVSTALASSASANTIRLSYEPGLYSGSGGAGEYKASNFTGMPVAALGSGVQVTTQGVTGAFQTFCLEYAAHFYPGTTYSWSLDTDARQGGGIGHGTVNGSDPLDARTAYLYTQFWDGVLAWTTAGGQQKHYDYTVGAGRSASGAALQNAIWYLEQERTLAEIGGVNSDAWQLVLQADAAVAQGGVWYGRGLGDIRVLNLTDRNGADIQSQLVRIVPLPPAALGGLALLAGLGVVRRRRRPAYGV